MTGLFVRQMVHMRQSAAVPGRRIAPLLSPADRLTDCAKEAFNKLLLKKYKIRRRNLKQSKEPAAYFMSPESGPQDTAGGTIRTATADRSGGAPIASVGRNHARRLRPQLNLLVVGALTALLFAPLQGGQPGARGAEPDGRMLVGHTNIVWSVAFSPDSQTLATASEDGTVRLWDVATGKVRRVLSVGRGLRAAAVTFARDGTSLAVSASSNRSDVPLQRYIKFWDTRAWRLTRTLHGGGGLLVLSPDDRLRATPYGDDDNQIKIWDVRSGNPVRVLDGHDQFGISALAFSPDSRLLASGGFSALRIWDVSTGAQHRVITRNDSEPIGPVHSLAWSPDGRTLASASGTIGEHNQSDKRITLWNPATGAVRGSLGDELELIHEVALSPDGRMAAGGTIKFVMVGVWELKTGKQIHFFDRNKGFITSLAFSPDSKFLASSSYDPVVWLWRMRMRP